MLILILETRSVAEEDYHFSSFEIFSKIYLSDFPLWIPTRSINCLIFNDAGTIKSLNHSDQVDGVKVRVTTDEIQDTGHE